MGKWTSDAPESNRTSGTPMLLAASPQLSDPYFKQAVVLLLQFNAEGALGFVINSQSQITLNEILVGEELNLPGNVPVWNAGPVPSDTGIILHIKCVDGLHSEIAFSSSRESLIELVKTCNDPAPTKHGVMFPYRLLVGYSGWGPGQLEEEIRTGSWIQAPLDHDIIFNTTEKEMWTLTLESIGLGDSSRLIVPLEQPYLQ